MSNTRNAYIPPMSADSPRCPWKWSRGSPRAPGDRNAAWENQLAEDEPPRSPSRRGPPPGRGVRCLLGSDHVEVRVQEDVVHVGADVVDLVLTAAELHDPVDQAAGVLGQRRSHC